MIASRVNVDIKGWSTRWLARSTSLAWKALLCPGFLRKGDSAGSSAWFLSDPWSSSRGPAATRNRQSPPPSAELPAAAASWLQKFAHQIGLLLARRAAESRHAELQNHGTLSAARCRGPFRDRLSLGLQYRAELHGQHLALFRSATQPAVTEMLILLTNNKLLGLMQFLYASV